LLFAAIVHSLCMRKQVTWCAPLAATDNILTLVGQVRDDELQAAELDQTQTQRGFVLVGEPHGAYDNGLEEEQRCGLGLGM
jgi:hypothetical protein